jgi:hypothetical protein
MRTRHPRILVKSLASPQPAAHLDRLKVEHQGVAQARSLAKGVALHLEWSATPAPDLDGNLHSLFGRVVGEQSMLFVGRTQDGRFVKRSAVYPQSQQQRL